MFFGVVFCGSPALARRDAQGCEPGDLVKVAALPDYCCAWEKCENVALQCHAATLRRCLGRVFRVVSVGENGWPELEVSSDVSWHNLVYTGEQGRPKVEVFNSLHRGEAVACAISIEPKCAELVARRATLPVWNPPSWAVQ
jgi:hypothetical protein